jgi:hypothetical protein
MTGATTDLAVRIAGVEAGRATHAWTRDRERWRAALDLVPVGSPPFVLHVEAAPLPAERSRADNAADVLVQSDARRLRVLVYEPRPSWASTSVRRALEDDPRVAVASVSYASRGIASATAGVQPSRVLDDDLDRFDAIVVGGLERLTAADVRALDRFMRERGGSVVLLPDARVDAGPVRDLMPGSMLSQVLLEKPASLEVQATMPRLDASEILVAREVVSGADVLARMSGSNDAVVFASPRGDGRLLFSGALDAWRFRGDRQARFDRFWRSAIAGTRSRLPSRCASS